MSARGIRRAGAGLAAGIVVGVSGLSAAPAYAAPDKDCPDFPSQAAAQKYFRDNGGSKANNVDLLDRNRNGVACETSRNSNPATDFKTTRRNSSKPRTSNPPQVANPPAGAVEAGGGDTSGVEAVPLLATGTALTGAGALLFAISRRRRTDG